MDFMTMMSLAKQAHDSFKKSAEGGANFLSSTGNGGKPYGDYERSYDDYLNRANKETQPIYDAGTAAINPFSQRLQQMSDPSKFVNDLQSKYQESPFAKYQQDQLVRSGTNAASASGLVGSTPFAQFLQKGAHDISSEDMDKYLQNTLGVNKDYMSGENNLINYGQNAATNRSSLYNEAAPRMAEAQYGKARTADINAANRYSGLLDMFTG